MSHNRVTHSPIPTVPRQPYLLRRNGRYHINVRVPNDLRAALNREHFREALHTGDRSEALRLLWDRLPEIQASNR